MQEEKPKDEALEEGVIEEFSITEEKPEEPTDIGHQPEKNFYQEHVEEPEELTYKPRKKRSWKKWAIGLSIAAGLGIAGDAYFQGTKPEIKLNYGAGKGWVQVYEQAKVKGLELYNKGTAEASRYYKENLEGKINYAKTVTKYEENKFFYGMGIGALAGISIYTLIRRKKKGE